MVKNTKNNLDYIDIIYIYDGEFMDGLNATTTIIRRKMSRTPIQCSANLIAFFFADDAIWIMEAAIDERTIFVEIKMVRDPERNGNCDYG